MTENKFANLTDEEIYVLKRAMIESSYNFNNLAEYLSDKSFMECAQRLLNELCDEDVARTCDKFMSMSRIDFGKVGTFRDGE